MTSLDPTIGRFFIALLPPETIQAEITEIKQIFKDRYNSGAALRSPPHITLQPPFQWPLAEIPRLHRQLQEFVPTLAPLPISLSGFAAFPPRVIFVDVHLTPALAALQQDLGEHLRQTLQIEDPQAKTRPFHPHMTVAFRDLTVKQFKLAWSEFQSRPYDRHFLAADLTLLSHDGRRWLVSNTYPFRGDCEAASDALDKDPPSLKSAADLL